MKTKPILVILLVVFVTVNLIILGIILFQRGLFGSSEDVRPDFAENINYSDNTNTVQDTNILLNTNSSSNTNAVKNTNSASNTNLSQNVNVVGGASSSYTSGGLGLKLELPAIFHVTDIFGPQDDFFQAETYDPSQYTFTDAPIVGLKIEIYLAANTQNLDLMEWIVAQGYSEMEPNLTLTETTVGGKKALERETLTKVDATRDIFVARGDQVYIIFVTGDRASYDSNINVIQSLINSITFTK